MHCPSRAITWTYQQAPAAEQEGPAHNPLVNSHPPHPVHAAAPLHARLARRGRARGRGAWRLMGTPCLSPHTQITIRHSRPVTPSAVRGEMRTGHVLRDRPSSHRALVSASCSSRKQAPVCQLFSASAHWMRARTARTARAGDSQRGRLARGRCCARHLSSPLLHRLALCSLGRLCLRRARNPRCGWLTAAAAPADPAAASATAAAAPAATAPAAALSAAALEAEA